MAGDEDQTQKTEEPTPRKLEEARKKGQVANSREVNHWLIILGGAVAFMAFASGMSKSIINALSRFVTEPDLFAFDRVSIGSALSGAVVEVMMAMLPFIAMLLIAAIMTGIIQTGFLISFDRIKPELSKLSVFKGLKRLFSLKSISEFLKSVFKLIIVGAVVAALVSPVFDNLPRLMTLATHDVMDLLLSLAVRLFIGVLSIMTVITVIDVLYQKFEHTKSQRMTRQEVKDELKQSEGDPQVKARLRQIRTERARRRMMASVPEADVIITNPTHFAVALKYAPEEMAAPRLLAKGADAVAARIREIANENNIPLVENPPLARALFESVDIDSEIPPEHYKAAAEIISYVFQLRGRTMPR